MNRADIRRAVRTKLGIEALEDRRVPAVVYALAAAQHQVGEGQGSFDVTVTRTGSVDAAGSVEIVSVDGTARMIDQDFAPLTGPADGPMVVAFAAGEASKTVTVSVTDDSAVEGTETFQVKLQNPSEGGTLGTTTAATVIIADNDQPPVPMPTPVAQSADEKFVNQMYKDLLGREADAAGRTFWADQLAGGATRESVAFQVTTSDEYRVNELKGIYRQFLGREADADGLAIGLNLYRQGYTYAMQQGRILASAEYIQKKAGNNLDNWLGSIFRDVLKREVTGVEANTFKQYMTFGLTAEQVGLGICLTPEAYIQKAQGLYTGLLKRPGNSAELSGWVSAFQAGVSHTRAVSVFVGSAEYYGKANMA